ncbi:hypothetical protein [Nitrolancea hollandica]|uniref:Uncharacterized protein n=1 Tax=Nitrolancea hollandica Lb TaxID=1129897 RepID=I4EL22_9BACT|nr:hypothetical protein [Nitrolancea hollandica]CCF85384.1 hypothetical protein NITHO_4900001 [Nitrolancea hollandica Lb]
MNNNRKRPFVVWREAEGIVLTHPGEHPAHGIIKRYRVKGVVVWVGFGPRRWEPDEFHGVFPTLREAAEAVWQEEVGRFEEEEESDD